MIRRFAARALAIALLAVGIPVAVSAAPASAANQWNDGAFANSSIINCASMIFGNPYLEVGMMTYVGYFGDPQSSVPKPAVGETFSVHVVVGGVGNACAGQYAQPALVLPPGLSIAGQATCFGTNGNSSGQQACTHQQLADGRILFSYTDNGQTSTIWPVPSGATWEMQLPVRATSQLVGQLQGRVSVADGNDNPTLVSTAGVYVLPSTSSGVASPQFAYPTPSTEIKPGNPPVHTSRGFVTTPKSGTAKFQVKSGGTYFDVSNGSIFLNQAATWVVSLTWADSPQLQGNTWPWRLCFTPTSGSTSCGPEQVFTALTSDSTAPTINSITLINNARTGTPSDRVTTPTFTVRMTFSEPVTGVEDGLFASNGGQTLPNPETVVVTPNSNAGKTFSSTYDVTLQSGVGGGKRGVGLFGASLTVKDRAGNGLANTRSLDVFLNTVADTTAPTITTAALPTVLLASTAAQNWTASDAGSGLAFFTVQSRRTTLAGSVGALNTPGDVVGPAVRSATVDVAQGITRCVKVTATDASGNSQAGTVRCTTKPMDERATSATGSWTNVAASTAFRGTLVRSSSVGATRFLTGVKAKKVIVVAEKRPGAGSIRVLVNGSPVGSVISLASSSVQPKQKFVVNLGSVASNARIAVKVTAAGSTGVRIDALGAIPS